MLLPLCLMTFDACVYHSPVHSVQTNCLCNSFFLHKQNSDNNSCNYDLYHFALPFVMCALSIVHCAHHSFMDCCSYHLQQHHH